MRFALIILFVITLGYNQKPKDILWIDKQIITFDQLKTNERFNISIKIKNITSDTIHIDRIITSCECVTIDQYPDKISPNQYDSIPFTFVTDKTGFVSRGFSIFTREQQRPIHILIEGDVM